MKQYLFALITLSAALSAQAAWSLSCTMTQECYETEACSESAFAFELSETDGLVTMSTEFGDFEMTAINGLDDTIQSYTGAMPWAVHMLTVSGNNDARYATHMTDGLTQITYTGACEVTE